MLNKVMLIGNLGADPEARYTQDGTCVCNIRIATTERFKDRDGQPQDRTEWHRVVLWGRLGETAKEYLRKGSRVYIEGRIETHKWQDRDGNDRYTTEIRARDMRFLGGGRNDQGGQGRPSGGYGSEQRRGGGYPSHSAPQPAQQGGDPFPDQGEFGDLPPGDDIPF